MYRAFCVWREANSYHTHILQRVKLRIIYIHKKSLSRFFFKWKESIDKKHVVELVSFTEELENENIELQNTIQG